MMELIIKGEVLMEDKVIIIAEIGECFNGDLDTARRLIAVAREAGCDFAKFQTLDKENIADDDPEREWFRKVALDSVKIQELVAFGNSFGIQVLFTPENTKTAKWLFDLGLRDVKIASSCLADVELAEYINGGFQRVFMSTGMGLLDEINHAVHSLRDVPELYIMHCISEYPTGALLEKRGLRALAHGDVRFRMMQMLMALFPKHRIGYSDHTVGLLAPIVAVAMGAKVIEKHITLDRRTPVENYRKKGEYLGTDHVLSLEPEELKEMVRQIREVEKMFGPWKWERSEGELLLREFLRDRFAGK